MSNLADLSSLSLFFAGGFILSVGGAFVLTRLIDRRKATVAPERGAILRIRSGSSVYRSRLVAAEGSTWEIATPMKRDSYVPLRIGEELVIEAAAQRGAMVFRTVVTARDPEDHRIFIERPSRVHLTERREHSRLATSKSPIRVNGKASTLLDISSGGARVEAAGRLMKGDRTLVEIPALDESLHAWVLEAEDGTARLRFEELIDLAQLKKKSALANA